MPDRSLVPVLREHVRQMAMTPVPVGAKHRIAAALRERAQRQREATDPRRLLPMLTFVAGAALVMVVAGYNLLRSPRQVATPVPSAVASLAGYTVHGDACAGRMDGTVTQLSGPCRLVGPSMQVQTWEDVRLVSGPTTVELLTGTASFDVAKVAPGDPSVRIVVSHGIIEVLGTRFTIEQDEGGGAVELFEGHIRYVPVNAPGEAIDLLPGGRHAWGDRAPPVTAPAHVQAHDDAATEGGDEPPARPEPPRTRKRQFGTEAEADAIIADVTALRAKQQYRAAVRVLRRALKRRWRARIAQVLSYELGSILERQLADPKAACRHWSRHQARYPAGRYAGAIALSVRRCSD